MSAVTWNVRHLDLALGLPELGASPAPVYAVFWWGSLALGARAYLPQELPLRRDQLASTVARMAADQLLARRSSSGEVPPARSDGRPDLQARIAAMPSYADPVGQLQALASPAGGPVSDLSVIICTRDRPEALSACLAALARQNHAPGEVVVVDNSTSRTAESACLAHPQVRYVHEPRPGLSIARNAGIAAARRPLLAFTDDDVEVHPNWTAELVQAFSQEKVEAVTGLVLPASLGSEAQQTFQFEMGGFGERFVPMIFGPSFLAQTRHEGAQVWRIGAGANMAFRRRVFDRVGLFDERLGAGASGCSEDSELWYRILAAGGTCFYEPRAVVFHHHRADWIGLRRQIRDYMCGHVAALFVQYDRHRDAGNLVRIYRQLPRYFMGTAIRALKNSTPRRSQILYEEIRGWARGLQYAFRRSWRAGNGLPPT